MQQRLARAGFVLGSGRSGTTLLRVMLAGHPELWAPPETFLSAYETMAERKAHVTTRFWEKGGLRRALMDLQGLTVDQAKAAVDALDDWTVPEVFAWLQAQLGRRMLVEKTPVLSIYPDALRRLEQWFDDARYIWIVRHPGSVIRSFQNMPMAEAMTTGFGADISDVWKIANHNLGEFLATVPAERWLRIRYEDLVTEPRAVMERVCDTLGVPFHESVLQPYEGDRMREGPKGARAIGDPQMAGRKHIDPKLATQWLENFDPRKVDDDTRRLALHYGYDISDMPLPPIAKVSEAIDALWETARTLERAIDLPQDIDAVEGRRFLLRMVGASIDTFTEHDDVERPRFHDAEGPTRKMFADCPDADYLRAPVSLGPGRVYRVWGRVPPGTLYAGLLLYGKGGRPGRRLVDAQLGLDAEGRFEVRVSTEPQDGVWLRGDGDETAVLVRQYFADRTDEPQIEVNIELLGEKQPARPLDATHLARQLDLSRRMLESVFKRTIGAWNMVRGIALNQFIEVPGEQLFPTPDNRYLVCWYRFGRDQVMLVRGKLPRARYFGLSLCNAWLESLDYRRHTVNLNHSQLVVEADGSFEVCLAHRDPGHANWLDTSGHHAGYLLVRHLLLEGDPAALSLQVMYEPEWEAEKLRRSKSSV